MMLSTPADRSSSAVASPETPPPMIATVVDSRTAVMLGTYLKFPQNRSTSDHSTSSNTDIFQEGRHRVIEELRRLPVHGVGGIWHDLDPDAGQQFPGPADRR